MVEKQKRFRVGDQPREAVEREWEVFVRDATKKPLRHVGSISAPSAEVAYEQASKLFAWYATDVWLCPADAVSRYSTHTLDDHAEPVPLDTGGEERSYEA
jgi:rSAM-partnered protein